MFRVGQKVVCVTATPLTFWEDGAAPINGQIYTVHSVFAHPRDGEAMVRLVEVRRGMNCIQHNGHDGYGAWRFRPVVERKTDISIFKAMLNPSKQSETV